MFMFRKLLQTDNKNLIKLLKELFYGSFCFYKEVYISASGLGRVYPY